jgi:hypothetical protein
MNTTAQAGAATTAPAAGRRATRTGYLLAAIQTSGSPVTTQQAEQLLAASPFSSHRNSARKSLRTLTRDGLLTATDTNGRRTYRLNQQRSAAA